MRTFRPCTLLRSWWRREDPKHKDTQKMVRVVLDDMIPRGHTSSTPDSLKKPSLWKTLHRGPRIQISFNYKGEKAKEKPEFGARGQPAMGKGTREGWEGRGRSRSSDRASKILRDQRLCAEQVDSHPRPMAPRAPCTRSPPAFCCSQHLPPQPSSGPPPWSSGRLLAAHPKASVNPRRTSLWLPSPPPMDLRNTHLPARSLWEPLEFMSWAKSCLTAAAIFLPAQPNRKRV